MKTWAEQRAEEFAKHLKKLQDHPRFKTATAVPWDRPRYAPGHLVTISDMELPEGWNRPKASVAFWVDAYFPSTVDRGFWTLPNLWLDTGFRRADGCWPRMTVCRPDHQPLGHEKALWWMWGPTHWSAIASDLVTLAQMIRMRFDPSNEIESYND